MSSYLEEKPMPYNEMVVNSFFQKQYFHVLVLIHYDSDRLFYGITDLCTLKTVNV